MLRFGGGWYTDYGLTAVPKAGGPPEPAATDLSAFNGFTVYKEPGSSGRQDPHVPGL